MVKLFSEQPTLYPRALQIWQILISKATNRQTLTYTELAKTMHLGGPFGPLSLKNYLDPVMSYCQVNNLPPLTIIVVNKATGEPGSGLSGLNNLNKDREAVFNYDWFGIIPPTPTEFEATHKN